MTVLPGPLTSYLKLAATPRAVSYARQHTKQEILEWDLPELADTAELLVSELVTNAVRATHHLEPQDQGSSPYWERPSILVWLTSEQGAVLIRVWDNNSQMPACQDADPYAEAGRGIALVATLADDWGAYRKLLGKVTWCLLCLNSYGAVMKDERKDRLAAVMGARYQPTGPASPWFTRAPAIARGGRVRLGPGKSAAEL
jgi:anti-sigma regulatory factor (Ser/Thr protein kinase)